jgi:rare lipoprotein A
MVTRCEGIPIARPKIKWLGLAIYVAMTLLGLFAVGCTGPLPHTKHDLVPGQTSVVHASYYSRTLAGRKTASGERYNPALYTAAHGSYPLGTILRVTRLPNGPSVDVRINDRCGCTHGRQIDLSEAAARKLGMLREGVAKVRMEILGHRPLKKRS